VKIKNLRQIIGKRTRLSQKQMMLCLNTKQEIKVGVTIERERFYEIVDSLAKSNFGISKTGKNSKSRSERLRIRSEIAKELLIRLHEGL
jgi:hypothetical protein